MGKNKQKAAQSLKSGMLVEEKPIVVVVSSGAYSEKIGFDPLCLFCVTTVALNDGEKPRTFTVVAEGETAKILAEGINSHLVVLYVVEDDHQVDGLLRVYVAKALDYKLPERWGEFKQIVNNSKTIELCDSDFLLK